MARWSIPIPVLDPLYDLQLRAWRETFDFDRSREGQPADGRSIRRSDLVHADARSRTGQAAQDASHDDTLEQTQ